MKSVEERLAALERGVKLWRVAACCLAAALIVAVSLAAAPQGVPDFVEAHCFRVRDANGRIAAVFGEFDGTPAMSMTSDKDKSEIRLVAGPHGATIHLKNDEGVETASISTGTKNSPYESGLRLNDRSGNTGIIADANETAGGTVQIFAPDPKDQTGHSTRARLAGKGDNQRPELQLYGPDEKVIWSALPSKP